MAEDQNLSGTIQLNDGVTKTLQSIIASLKSTTDAVSVMQKELGQNVDTAALDRMKKSLDTAKASVDATAKALPPVKKNTDDATAAVEKATKALKGITSGAVYDATQTIQAQIDELKTVLGSLAEALDPQ